MKVKSKSPKTMDPSTRFVRSLDGEYFMLREAAEILGVGTALLRSAMKDDVDLWGPSFCAFFGKVKIYLYTKDDIDRIGENLSQRKRVFRNTENISAKGRPMKWSNEERIVRQRLYSRSHYYRRRVVDLTAAGDSAGTAAAQLKVDETNRKLKDQEDK